MLGAKAAAGATGLGAYGADRILACADESLDAYQAQAYAVTLAAAAEQQSAMLVLEMPGTLRASLSPDGQSIDLFEPASPMAVAPSLVAGQS